MIGAPSKCSEKRSGSLVDDFPQGNAELLGDPLGDRARRQPSLPDPIRPRRRPTWC
jgi:hypothetical protein